MYFASDNDLSKELAATIDNRLVLKKLTDPNNFLAVKLKSGSENYYTYFAQIYQFVPVPSLFFIGRNGTPLEVVCAGVEPQSLATRIDRILQEHRKLVFGKEDKNPPQPSTSAQNVRDETINFIQSEASQSTSAQKVEKIGETEKLTLAKENSPLEPKVTGTKNAHADEPESSAPAAKIAKTETSNIEYEVVCDGDVCVRRPKDQAGPSSVEDKRKVAGLGDKWIDTEAEQVCKCYFGQLFHRWNVTAGSRNIIMQSREAVDKKRETKLQLLLVTPQRVTILKCIELSQEFNTEPIVGLQINEEDEEALKMFMSFKPEKTRTLADIIKDKITDKHTELHTQFSDVETLKLENIDPRIKDMYEGVKNVLQKYRSGKLPKAFKMVPHLQNWESVSTLLWPGYNVNLIFLQYFYKTHV